MRERKGREIIIMSESNKKEKEKSVYELEDAKVNEWKDLQEKYVRWQDKRISLLTFSINLLFTISVASLGFIINNLNSSLFYCNYFCGYPLLKAVAVLILISIILGAVALFSRLCDFRLTAKIVRKRQSLFKVENGIDCESKQLQAEIDKLRCKTDCLGKATWVFFKLQAIVFLTAISLLIFNL